MMVDITSRCVSLSALVSTFAPIHLAGMNPATHVSIPFHSCRRLSIPAELPDALCWACRCELFGGSGSFKSGTWMAIEWLG